MANCCENRITLDGPSDEVLSLCAYIAPDRADGTPAFDIAAGRGIALPVSTHTARVLERWGTTLPELARSRDADIFLTRRPTITAQPASTPPTLLIGPELAAGPRPFARRIVTATFAFDSAWGPPAGWLRTVACLFPQLRIRLHYVVMDLPCAGWRTCVGDECEGAEYHDQERIDAIADYVYAA